MRKYLTIISSVALLVSGCDGLMPDNGPHENVPDVVSAKIVNANVDASAGKLIVKVDEPTAEAFSSGDFSSIDAVAGAVTCRRVFPVVERTEEKARAFGLHLWYVLGFESRTDLNAVSVKLAGLRNIEKVQFCNYMKKASDGISHPYIPSVKTKASMSSASVMDDPALPDQWHYSNDGDKQVAPTAVEGADISLPDAWRLEAGDPSVIVAVLDEGVQYDHPDLEANMWVNPNPGADGYANDVHGYNFVGNGGKLRWDAKGSSGHGTHVAGTVAAVNNNGIGVCGVAGGDENGNGVRIMSCQIFDGFNGGTPDVIAEAAKYAADHGASVLQCSFGVPGGAYYSDAHYQKNNGVEYDAFKYFMGESNCPAMAGGLIIFAAGNEGIRLASYPGACKDFISVTSIAADGLPAYYTNYGPGSNVAAPGGEYDTGKNFVSETGQPSEVLSTMPTESFPLYVLDQWGNEHYQGETAAEYGYMQGTSMACPHVSGIAALGLSYALSLGKHFSREEMASMILTSVDDIDSRLEGTKDSYAGGRMNLINYRKKMGTGKINAWKLMMQVEGTPYVQATVGKEIAIDLEEYFGEGAEELSYIGTEMSDEGMAALGLTEVPDKPRLGRIVLTPKKIGAAKITVKAIAGGSDLGGGDNIGGMEISKEISVIARGDSGSTGGWL